MDAESRMIKGLMTVFRESMGDEPMI